MIKKFIALAFVTALSVFSARSVHADPVLGEQLYYTGGDVTFDVLSASAAYHNFLGLYLLSPGPVQQGGVLAENHESAGDQVVFDPSLLGYSPGDELIFGIAVYRGGSHESPTNFLALFFTGAGSRNPDGVEHAMVDALGGGQYLVGFEDLWGGGDRDYNDTRFLFTGGVTNVPEPVTLGLFGIAIIGLAIASRRRRRVQI